MGSAINPWAITVAGIVTAAIALCLADIRARLVRRHGEDREAILAAVRSLAPNGYSNAIEREAERRLDRKLQFGGLFFHLMRLERDGLIGSQWRDGSYPRRRLYFVRES